MSGVRAVLRGAVLLLLLLAGRAGAAGPADDGDAIYRRGVLPDGRALRGLREAGGELQGTAAACINCHQRSGLGGREGRIAVPPIAARYLFRGAGPDVSDLPYLEGARGDRPAYTEATLARVLREGIDTTGRHLADVMPRYALSDAEVAALAQHLRRIDRPREAGVTSTQLHFATIVTPDADPQKKQAMLDVMQHFVAERNARQMAPVPSMKTSARTAYARSMFMVHRKWVLHVWQLEGAPAGWGAQLDRLLAEEPVFAVVSGLAGRDWSPVHAFCERAAVPCVFPNVEAPPPQADRDFYPLYLSRGVLLEADLAARGLAETLPGRAARTVVQVCREGDVGEAAAQALAAALQGTPQRVETRLVRRDAPPSEVAATVAAALGASPAPDGLVLWLRPADIAALDPLAAPPLPVWLSGRMAGLERAPVPPAWREGVRLLYPFDLPQRRRVRVDYATGWMSANRIPITAEQVQADTYLVLGLVSETLQHMTDAFVREYLVERLQNTLDHRIITGYYPRLSLAPGQRFASKGGYVARFETPSHGLEVAGETDWTVP